MTTARREEVPRPRPGAGRSMRTTSPRSGASKTCLILVSLGPSTARGLFLTPGGMGVLLGHALKQTIEVFNAVAAGPEDDRAVLEGHLGRAAGGEPERRRERLRDADGQAVAPFLDVGFHR